MSTKDPAVKITDEMSYLAAHGEETTELRSELESLLGNSQRTDPTPQPDSPVSSEPDYRLPVSRDGTEITLDPTPAPRQTQQGQQPAPAPAPITQDKALDPYAVDAPRTALDADSETAPGEVTIEADGKVRDPKTGRFVPHQAFHEERTRRKELEAKTVTQQEQLARVQERLSVLTEIIQGQEQLQRGAQKTETAPEPEAEINPEVDVFASVAQLQKRDGERAARLAEIERNANQRIDAIQQEALYRQDALTFAMKTPDFPDAYRYFNERRRDELKILGFTDEAQIDNRIMGEERALMALGLREKRSPSQIIYDMARNRGYAPKASEPAPAPAPITQTAQPVQAAQPTVPQISPDSAQRVQNTQNGQGASRSLSGAGGASGDGLTVQQLADMSEEDFLQFAGKIGAKKLDRLLGWKG